MYGCSSNNLVEFTSDFKKNDEASSNESPSSDYEVIEIDSNKTVITFTLPEVFPWTSRDTNGLSPTHPDESYTVIRVLSYPSRSLGYDFDLERVYASFIPRFEDLDYPGADEIRRYYANMYELDKAKAEELSFDKYNHGIPDLASESHHYTYRDWDSYIVGNYLVVTWLSTWYAGGAHGGQYHYTEHFNLLTGAMLTNEDVFGDIEKAANILNPIITQHLENEHNWHSGYVESINIVSDSRPYSPSATQLLLFRLESDGIVFIFNEYSIASYADGIFFVYVPYSELQEILCIDV